MVRTVLDLAVEFPSLQLIPIIYDNKEETATLVAQWEKRVDEILCTGSIPYYIAIHNLELHVPILCVRLVGANLLRCCLTSRATTTLTLAALVLTPSAAKVYALKLVAEGLPEALPEETAASSASQPA